MTDQGVGASHQLDFAYIARCIEGLRNWRALLLLTVGLIVASLLFSAGMASGRMWVIVIVGLLAWAVAASAASGVGVLLMDQARQVPIRGLLDAFVFGVVCLARGLLLALGIGLVFVALALVTALVFLICKIPGVGPIVFGLTFPLFVVIWGIAIVSVFIIVVPLAMPALWEGRTTVETAAIILAAARERQVVVLLSMIVLYIIVAIVASLVGSAFFSGVTSTGGIAAGVIGPQAGNITDLFGQMFGGGQSAQYQQYEGRGSSGFGTALGIDLTAMGAILAALLGQVFVMGINLVYLSSTAGLDTAKARRDLDSGIARAKEKADQLKQQAQAAAERAKQAAEKRGGTP